MSNNIQIKRGFKAGLPNLEVGEFGLAIDTNEVFIGTLTGNELVNNGGGGGGGDYDLTKSKIETALVGSGLYSIQLGQNASASGNYSTALGRETTASGVSSTALGRNATASAPSSTALGQSASAEHNASIAIGNNASAKKHSSIALGVNARADGLNSIAIGTETVVTEDWVADFGSYTQVRVNLTPVNDRDAVSKKYLENVIGNIDDILDSILGV